MTRESGDNSFRLSFRAGHVGYPQLLNPIVELGYLSILGSGLDPQLISRLEVTVDLGDLLDFEGELYVLGFAGLCRAIVGRLDGITVKVPAAKLERAKNQFSGMFPPNTPVTFEPVS